MRLSRPHWIWLITLAWAALNLAQAAFSELTSDEGYYWFCSRALQWGYYEHPPMVPLLVRAGTLLFKGELGVRFFMVLLSSASIWLLFQMAPEPTPESDRRLVLLVLSAPLLSYLAFLTFPDGPLLFFSLLFLFFYRRHLDQDDAVAWAGLGCSAALMLYSKYHGVLVIGFVVLSNPKLLRAPSFWKAAALCTALFIPHLAWQAANGYPSVRFHLSGRTTPFGFKNAWQYLSQQLPALGPVLIAIPWLHRPKDLFERALLFIAVGAGAFFLAASLRMFVHFHWTSIALFPLVLLAVRYFQKPRSRAWPAAMAALAALVLAIRLSFVIPSSPLTHSGPDYYHRRPEWAEDIARVAAERPVLFGEDYRSAGLYWFYAGRPGIALQRGSARISQYELWGMEHELEGREVMLVRDRPFDGSTPLPNRMGPPVHYAVVRYPTTPP